MKYLNSYYNKMLKVLNDYIGKIKFKDSYFKVTDEEFTIKYNNLSIGEIPIKVSIYNNFNNKYDLITVTTDKMKDYSLWINKDNDSIEYNSNGKEIKESTFNNAFNRTLKYLLNRIKLQANYDRINNKIA